MKLCKYHNGESVYRKGDSIDQIYVVESGCLEVFTYFEGNKFVIEHLTAGSILNMTNFFLEDIMQVEIASNGNSVLHELTKEGLENVKNEHMEFRKYMNLYENRMLRTNKNYPLDFYIPAFISKTKILEDAKIESMKRFKTPKKEDDVSLYLKERMRLERQGIFKNCVYRKIVDIQREKRKPKLREVLDKCRELAEGMDP